MQNKILILQKLGELNSQESFLYSTMCKKTSTAILLTLFLGGIGIQWFYLDKIWVGILSIIFCWTFIPGIISVCFLFFANNVVMNYNMQVINQLVAQRK